MKKVLFVATVVREHINVFHTPFLKLFKDNGWETYVAASNDYFDNPKDCIIPYCDHYIEIPFQRSPFAMGNFTCYKMLEKIISEEDFDIIHCHTPVGGMLTRLAARKARKHGTRVIYTAHGFHFYSGAPIINWLFFYPAEKILSFFTDDIILINGEDFKRAKKFHAKRIHYVQGVGINEARFTTSNNEENYLRKEQNIDDNTFIVLFIGELIKRKNIKTLLEAINRIKNENIACLICGSGVLKDELQRYVDENGLNNIISFLGFRNDIPHVLLGSNVFVFPSYQEGLPVAVMEAMEVGLPIVASNVRGTNDLVLEGENGFLLKPEDAVGFAERIIFLKNHPKMCHEMGLKSKQLIKPFLEDKVIEKMAKIYGLNV